MDLRNSIDSARRVWKYFKYLEISDLDIKSANALYASLISDTGSFRYNSTTSECHVMAKELLENGVKPYYVFSNIYEQRKIKQIKLFSLILQNINYFNNNEFASVRITREMLDDTKCTSDDVEGIPDFIRSIKRFVNMDNELSWRFYFAKFIY